MCSPKLKGHADLTSSLPSSGFQRQSLQFLAPLPQGKGDVTTDDRGCARYRTQPDISRHELTTAMHHLSLNSRRHPQISKRFSGCQTLVRFFALHRIKPHTPPLVRAPVNSFEFHTCVRTPQAEHLTRWLRHRGGRFPRHLVFIVYGQDYRGI